VDRRHVIDPLQSRGHRETEFKNATIGEKVLGGREIVRGNLELIVKSPVKEVGTDSMHGAMYFEMEVLVDFGALPMRPILAATRNDARLRRLADEVGTLEKCKVADFIALRKNPLEEGT
jgi:hypothetical protein